MKARLSTCVSCLLFGAVLASCSARDNLASQPVDEEVLVESDSSRDTGITMNDSDGYKIPEALPRELGTPVLDAIAHRDMEALDKLLQRDVDLNASNHADMTPLFLAVLRGYDDIVVTLLDNGADIDYVVPGTATIPMGSALSYGREHGDWTVYEIFVSRGADVTRRTSDKPSSFSFLDSAAALSEFCRVKPLFEKLPKEQLEELRNSKISSGMIFRRKGINEEEEACRLEIVALFD